MAKTYNEFAGQNLKRLEALSDGIFAFAMTLLALDIRVPEAAAIHSEADLARSLVDLFPRIFPWIMSFLTLGIFWVGQQTQLSLLKHTNRHYTWISLAFLAFVTAVPFTTRLLVEFAGYRLALLVYWANILALGLVILASWLYACRAGLIKNKVTEAVYHVMVRRVVRAQLFYAFGAALCLIHNNWSIGFILLVQLNYVLAPRFLVKYTS